MKSSQYRQIILLVTIISLIFPIGSAFQASCYGHDYGADDLNTVQSANDAKTILSNIGYTAQSYNDETASSALNRMKSDQIFFFYGHAKCWAYSDRI